MITESTLYWITRLDGINSLLSFISFLFLIISVFCLLGIFIHKLDEDDVMAKFLSNKVYAIPLCILFITLKVLTPTTKEMAMIYVIPKVANSDFVEKVGSRGDQLMDMAFDKLEDVVGVKE